MIYALFDIETRTDKRLLLDALCAEPDSPPAPVEREETAYAAYLQSLRVETGKASPMFPTSLHVPISIAVGVADTSDWKLSKCYSLGDSKADIDEAYFEQTLVQEFWSRAEALGAQGGCLVTFNGRGFDFPVLELAALRHGIPAPRHWTEKYGNRYRYQADHHIDLLDLITNGRAWRQKGGLDLLVHLIGRGDLAKGDISGADVQTLYDEGRLEDIDRYCRNDVRRLYRLFLRVMYVRGSIPEDVWRAAEEAEVVLE